MKVKYSNFHFLIPVVYGGTLGLALGSAGVHPNNWQFWVIIVGSNLYASYMYLRGGLK